MDWAEEKAFDATFTALALHTRLRILFLDPEVRFFGTAIRIYYIYIYFFFLISMIELRRLTILIRINRMDIMREKKKINDASEKY